MVKYEVTERLKQIQTELNKLALKIFQYNRQEDITRQLILEKEYMRELNKKEE
ncbi:MAG: hypothetical protein ISP01_05185 [Methanobrevibacter arboriphilus]|uniref:Uncharacterized protein n=1 Tax=Methanobrevibacter arboriphilus TaxID=39441 RepID=A0A843AG91_METAZ|nr:hypothetical protein [Methanobrevibacter arboriphilus]MBF4468781.1 hypothetical protein [Methanobrevibacter arboriphilus]